jgi:hypothetical protein
MFEETVYDSGFRRYLDTWNYVYNNMFFGNLLETEEWFQDHNCADDWDAVLLLRNFNNMDNRGKL